MSTTFLGEPDGKQADLISRAKKRDPAAWSALYDANFPNLYRYARTRLRSPEDAEDVAAQVFLEALRGIDSYEDRGRPFLAWLYRIAHNIVIDRMRRLERARRAAAYLDAAPRHHPGLEGRIDQLDLLAAIEHLTLEQQEVIFLRYYRQMTVKEVGMLLGKADAAVFSLQARGIGALKRRLAGGLAS